MYEGECHFVYECMVLVFAPLVIPREDTNRHSGRVTWPDDALLENVQIVFWCINPLQGLVHRNLFARDIERSSASYSIPGRRVLVDFVRVSKRFVKMKIRVNTKILGIDEAKTKWRLWLFCVKQFVEYLKLVFLSERLSATLEQRMRLRFNFLQVGLNLVARENRKLRGNPKLWQDFRSPSRGIST